MKFASWKEIVELVGIAAIVASLLFVGLQMRQEQQIAIAETRTAVTQSIVEIAVMLEASSVIWTRGLDGEELSNSDQAVFLAMVEAVESHFFNMFLRFERLGIGPAESHARNWAYALYIHSGLRQTYLDGVEYSIQKNAAFEREPIPGNGFRVQVLAYLKQLDDRAPPIPGSKRYVFW